MAEHSHNERIRMKAYEIWLNEGRPEGRDQRHWEMARELVGHDDAHRSTLQPANGGGAASSNGGAKAPKKAAKPAEKAQPMPPKPKGKAPGKAAK